MLRIIFKGILWTVIAALTLECCARLDDWFSYGASPFGLYDSSVLSIFDKMGPHGRPYARYLKWKLNSQGFRGPELDPQAVPILCVGSSETFGQFETEGHEWPRELERLLNQSAPHGTRYQLVNVGFAGETFSTSVRRLPARLAAVRPKFVLLYPSLAHYLYLPVLQDIVPPPPQSNFRWRMQGRIENTLKQSTPMWLQTWLRQRQIRQALVSQPELANIPPQYRRQFCKDLEAAIELSRRAGAEPVLITHANRFKDRVDPSERFMLIAWRKFYPMLREDAFLTMEASMNDLMRQAARDNNVLLIDAAPAMPRGPNFFGDFVHFTDRGSAAFSAIIADKLVPRLGS